MQNENAAMTAAVKAASDEVLQAAAAVTKACNALDPAEGAKWAKRLDRVLDAVDAYAPPPPGAPTTSAIDATAGRLFEDIEGSLAEHDRAQGRPSDGDDGDANERGDEDAAAPSDKKNREAAPDATRHKGTTRREEVQEEENLK